MDPMRALPSGPVSLDNGLLHAGGGWKSSGDGLGPRRYHHAWVYLARALGGARPLGNFAAWSARSGKGRDWTGPHGPIARCSVWPWGLWGPLAHYPRSIPCQPSVPSQLEAPHYPQEGPAEGGPETGDHRSLIQAPARAPTLPGNLARISSLSHRDWCWSWVQRACSVWLST